MIIFDIWAWHIIFHTMSEPNYPLLSWAGFEVGTFQISAHIHECHPNSLITGDKKRQFNEQNGEGEISKWNFLWWVSKQRVNVVVVHSCWGNYGRGEGAVLLGGTSPEHPPWRNISRASSLEIPLNKHCWGAAAVQPGLPASCRDSFHSTTHSMAGGLLSPRNRDALGEAGLRPMPQTENASCPVKPTGSGWLSAQGCLSVSLKGPFRAEGGKTNLVFQCWRWQFSVKGSAFCLAAKGAHGSSLSPCELICQLQLFTLCLSPTGSRLSLVAPGGWRWSSGCCSWTRITWGTYCHQQYLELSKFLRKPGPFYLKCEFLGAISLISQLFAVCWRQQGLDVAFGCSVLLNHCPILGFVCSALEPWLCPSEPWQQSSGLKGKKGTWGDDSSGERKSEWN